jgi:hypothetical protein
MLAKGSVPIDVLWSAREWAEAIVRLPVQGPLPCRTVLVPRERVAHALRRELLRAGHPEALGGTRFLTPGAAATAALEAAGVRFQPGEDGLRRARLLALFRRGLPLQHFPLDLLRSRPGWEEAFAHTIRDLEGADLRPERLNGEPRLRDVATIWRALDESAGASWTAARILQEAAAALEARPGCWPFPGACLAWVTAETTAAEARLLRAILDVRFGLLVARPLRRHYLERIVALLGEPAGEAIRAARLPGATGSERDILASYLFEPPEVLADPSRTRSSGPDETVDLEEHAGVEAELEATADWVARQVLDVVPLADIAVLVPALDPLAGLVAERLARLPWPAGALPVHVAGGLPLAATAAGARALAVARALAAWLAGDALAAVLPALRTADHGRHLSHGAATDLVWSLGTAGGNASHPEGALEWAARAARREPDLAAQLERARAASEDPERSGLARQARDLERLLADLRAVRPALEALVDVARPVVAQAPLSTVWPALRGFLADWLLQPGDGPRVQEILGDRLDPLAASATGSDLAGEDALRVIEESIQATRLVVGRFGEPAVYVGAVHDAVGLRFRAVRVIGLAEGHCPAVPREDPVIPDVLRARLAPHTLPTAADRTLAALHALDRVVRDAETRVALSAPRLDVERSLREPSSVILEAAAALGRPNAATGERARLIPDIKALRRDAFLPARRAALAFRSRMPLAEAAWQDGLALGALAIPARWLGVEALDLHHVAALRDAGPLDGLLGARAGDVPMPGLAPGRPISPSALQRLLECPHRFLLEYLLGFREPAEAPRQREIGQPAYGSLFHLVAERFYRAHGHRFAACEGSLETWLAEGDAIVERAFAEFLEQYPLVGGAVRRRECERLREDLRDLLEHEWSRGGRRFVAVERPFGQPEPVELALGAHSLIVRGQIDQIEVEGDRVLVRDFKTGRAHPRLGKEATPDPILDVQIAVYGLVAARLAEAWRTPRRVGAAYVYVGRGPDERGWDRDFHEALEPAARDWLTTAAALLAERAFPRTPRPDDCEYCPFQPVCGEGVYERAAGVLAAGAGALERFRALKGGEPEAEDLEGVKKSAPTMAGGGRRGGAAPAPPDVD